MHGRGSEVAYHRRREGRRLPSPPGTRHVEPAAAPWVEVARRCAGCSRPSTSCGRATAAYVRQAVVRGRHLPGERLLDRVASLVVAAEGQDRAPERVLQLGCVGGVRRERGKNEADEACRVLPNLVARQLVHPAEEEPEACGGEDGRWHPLSGRCREGGGEHRDRSDQQEQAQCVARRPRIRGQSYERERARAKCPRATPFRSRLLGRGREMRRGRRRTGAGP
jgi:hypothetical protein